MLDCLLALCSAAKNRLRAAFAKGGPARGHWIDYASDRHSADVLECCRAIAEVFRVTLPLCLFWGLYSQMGTCWVFQAALMNGRLWGRVDIVAEQMGVFNCLLALVLVLVLVGYLVLPRLGPVARTPVAQIKSGIVLAALSFVLASDLQLYIDSWSRLQADPANPNVLRCTGNCVHILWQVPQYVAITMAEVLVSVAGLTMVYSLSPAKLKSTCAAVSSLSGAAGNLIVMLLSKADPVSWVAGRRQLCPVDRARPARPPLVLVGHPGARL